MADAVPALDELTPEWISALLGTKVSGVSAERIGTGQVGASYRLSLVGEGCPDTLVAKLPAVDPLSKATGKSHLTYLRESRFYQNFAGKKPMPVPDHLFIAFDEDSHDFALIMHDLRHHAAGNQLSTPSLEEAQLAVQAAAVIHAAWWGDPLLDTLDWLNGTKAVPPPLDVDGLYSMFWPGFCDRFTGRITPEMKTVGDAYFGHVGTWANSREGPRCLTHGDFRPDNMMYNLADAAKPIVIVDWQTVGVGAGASDIAYYTGTALDPKVRKEAEADLVAIYKQGLADQGVPSDDLADLWDTYRVSAFAGFLMGVTAAMVVEQTERGDTMFLTMCERSAAMVLDHAEVTMPGAS